MKKDLTGKLFGKLTVVSFHGKNKHSHNLWNCICECGVETIARSFHLESGHSSSCGCFRIARTKETNTKHQMCDTRMYSIWANMLTRATNPNFKQSKDYIDRGIGVCEEWRSFEQFYSDMHWSYDQHVESHGEADTSIDREDNNRGYCKDNCRWATRDIQNNNRRNVVN